MNESRIVIVAGGGGAIGSAIAKQFAKNGFLIGVLDQHENGMDALRIYFEANNYPFFCCKTDLADKQSVLEGVENCRIAFKSNVIGLVNCAAINKVEKFSLDTVEAFKNILNVNVLASVVPTGVCLENIIEQKGFIITLSSVAGFAPLYGRTSYCASKFALHGFFETLRTEQRNKIHIMLVCPTFVDTGFGNNENKKQLTQALTADEVAHGIWNAYLKKNEFLSIGKNANLARWIYRFFPKFYIKKMMQQNEF